MRAVDFSQWGGELRRSTVDCWKANGVNLAVVQYSHLMRQHIGVLREAGMPYQIYVYLYWAADCYARADTAIWMAKQAGPAPFVWLDAEDTTGPFQPQKLWDAARACEAHGVPYGIYTGRWVWVGHYGNPRGFEHLPLWAAQYTSEAPTPNFAREPKDFSAFLPYGGWTQPAILQWHNTTNWCNHSIDVNYHEGAFIPQPVPEEDDFMERCNGLAKPVDPQFNWENKHIDGDLILHVPTDFRQAFTDFLVDPDKVKAIQLDLFLKSGEVTILDGNGAWAGICGYRPRPKMAQNLHWQGQVNVHNGLIRFAGKGQFSHVGISGVWLRS